MVEGTTTDSPAVLEHRSAHASLAALGVHLQHLDRFGPIRDQVHIAQQTVRYRPTDTRYDAFIARLDGAHGLVAINGRRRPDAARQAAFGRTAGAAHAVLQDTLEAGTQATVQQLEAAWITSSWWRSTTWASWGARGMWPMAIGHWGGGGDQSLGRWPPACACGHHTLSARQSVAQEATDPDCHPQPALAWQLIAEARAAGIPLRLVVADALSGEHAELEAKLVGAQIPCVMGLTPAHSMWQLLAEAEHPPACPRPKPPPVCPGRRGSVRCPSTATAKSSSALSLSWSF
jgi:hypothetical protein